MSRNDGGLAFPITVGCDAIGEVLELGCEGMTLRDYFAAAAVSGVMIENSLDNGRSRLNNRDIAAFAYSIADSMIAIKEGRA